MFPVDFALETIERYSSPGELVVDPFCGRGTTVFAANALGRMGLGVEINAVGWAYAATKLSPAPMNKVLNRFKDLQMASKHDDLPDLPRFFTLAYAPNIRKFLAAARDNLNWKESHVDRTAMSVLLLYAHGNRKNSLSNQMRQTKAMSPAYALRWWSEREMKPPSLDAVDFLESRLARRYKYGSPSFDGHILRGDSARVLPRQSKRSSGWSLLLTSPPYIKMANYHYDQWIRLWLLGGAPNPVVNGGDNQSWFANSEKYRAMLRSVFGSLSRTAARNATLYVRTDAREATRRVTLETLKEVFPSKRVVVIPRPMKGASQTELYNGTRGPGEVDIRLT
jgi:hypothetical protein